MPTIFTEATFEQAVIELFESMGYTHLYAPDLERDYADPLLGNALREALARINPELPEDAVEEALAKVRNLDAGSLAQKNKRFTDYLRNGVPVKYFVRGEERSAWYAWWIISIRSRTPFMWSISSPFRKTTTPAARM